MEDIQDYCNPQDCTVLACKDSEHTHLSSRFQHSEQDYCSSCLLGSPYYYPSCNLNKSTSTWMSHIAGWVAHRRHVLHIWHVRHICICIWIVSSRLHIIHGHFGYSLTSLIDGRLCNRNRYSRISFIMDVCAIIDFVAALRTKLM